MRVYYDFEFLESHGVVDPISLGMVREDGQELYIVFCDFNTLEVARHDWLMKNVMTSIGHEEYTSHVTGMGTPVKDLKITDNRAMTKADARYEIIEFLEDIVPEFWAWYGAYDHVALCSLFGRMIDLPARFPMFTNDIKQLMSVAGNPSMPKQPNGHHNALDDARFNMVRYNFLMSRLNPPLTTWIIAASTTEAREWLEHNPRDKFQIITHPDHVRGQRIRITDDIVPLVPLTQEMYDNLLIARRY